MKWFFLMLNIGLSSCSLISDSNLKPRNVEEFYNTTGIEKYFLSDIPAWANFDSSAGCFKKTIFRYFELNQLMKSYSIDFNHAIQIQASFNEEWLKYKNSPSYKVISAREEERIFYKANDRVNAQINFFDIPKFKRINLIWVDEVLSDSKAEKKLYSLMNSSDMDKGVPILMTLCFSRQEVENRFPNWPAKILSAEMSSVFNKLGEKQVAFSFELDAIFNHDQEIFIYTQSIKNLSDIFHGKFKTIKY